MQGLQQALARTVEVRRGSNELKKRLSRSKIDRSELFKGRQDLESLDQGLVDFHEAIQMSIRFKSNGLRPWGVNWMSLTTCEPFLEPNQIYTKLYDAD